MTDLEIEKIVNTLIESQLTGYFIAQKTGITEQTILNYRNKLTSPTQANAKLLEYFFNDPNASTNPKKDKNLQNKPKIGEINHSTIVGSNVSGNGNNISNNSLSEVVKQLCRQLATKDEQIERLLAIIESITQK